MKKICALILAATLLSATAAFADNSLPKTLVGFTLGTDVTQYAECCNMELSSPMPDAPFLTEVHLTPDFIPGIRGGSLTYANCDRSGDLVRIKLKFHDRSQKLFNTLVDKYTAAYGKADSYQGDAFRNVIAWQWTFTKGKERVTLLLMWSRDKEIRPGVSIKMTLSSLFESEYHCFKKQFDRKERKRGGATKIQNLNDFVPQ